MDVRIEEIHLKKRIDRIHNFKADITGSNGHFVINEQRLQPYFWVVNCTSCVFPPNNHTSCFSFLLLISNVSHVSILSFYNSFSRSWLLTSSPIIKGFFTQYEQLQYVPKVTPLLLEACIDSHDSKTNKQYNTKQCRSAQYFITQGNYIGYMFRLLNSHLQAYFVSWVKKCYAHIGIPSCLHSWNT